MDYLHNRNCYKMTSYKSMSTIWHLTKSNQNFCKRARIFTICFQLNLDNVKTNVKYQKEAAIQALKQKLNFPPKNTIFITVFILSQKY